MNTKIATVLGLVLSVSMLANVYLYREKSRFEEAWLNQFIATSEIEEVLKVASENTSFEYIRDIAIQRFGEDNVQEVDLKDGTDSLALRINDTLLYFKSGSYFGSKANLPQDE